MLVCFSFSFGSRKLYLENNFNEVYFICLKIHPHRRLFYFSNARRFNPHDPNLEHFCRLSSDCFSCWLKSLSSHHCLSAFISWNSAHLEGCIFWLSPAFPATLGSHHPAAMSSAYCIPCIHSGASLKTCLLTLKCESWRQGAQDTEVQEARDGISQTFVFGAVGAQNTKVGFVTSTEMALKY